jgi:hypothetical protein
MSLALAGCASESQRIDHAASAAGLSRTIVNGTSYRHVVYSNAPARAGVIPDSASRLFVFLDGDGRPWSDDGRQPRADPTTRNALALKLLMQTPAAGIYISRPCYQQILDAGCSTASWTSARYANDIVASIASVVREVSTRGSFAEVVLIGYSGGGALAPLVAERLENVAAVITIAANLDTDAWTTYHHYLPLADSLNPATSDRAHPWREIHLNGELDTVVPESTTAAYFSRYTAATRWPYAQFDHVCCWAEQWPDVFGRITMALAGVAQ